MGRETTQPRNGRTRIPARHAPPVTEAEAVLVLHYGRLARLAYAVLPGSRDRHHRVLSAHALVQQALPHRWTDLWTQHPGVPAPRNSPESAGGPTGAGGSTGAPTDPGYARLRAVVLTAALADAGRDTGPVLRALRTPLLPRTWGLTLFPTGGGPEGLALERALAQLGPAERAAFALITLEGLAPAAASALLTSAGVDDPSAALRRATRLATQHPVGALAAADFDPCTVHARPTDLLRRRRRSRAAVIGAAVLAVAAVLVTATVPGPDNSSPQGSSGDRSGAAARPVAFGVAELVRVPADAWRHTARIDFTAWPARGDQVGDDQLLARALTLWAGAGGSATGSAADGAGAGSTAAGDTGTDAAPLVRAAPGTVPAAPVQPPRLLWSGHLDGAEVVLLDDGSNLARYTRPDRPTGTDRERLELTRSDESDVTSAGAVLLRSSPAGDRFLLAPWVDQAQLRDLRAPDTPATNLDPADGLTAPVAAPPATGCAHWPVLQLRSSPVIAEHHAFLLTDLGGITATHLTYTPPPTKGPANYPREATGTDALLAWARLGCTLGTLHGQDVKAVNAWEFAQQPLPEAQGTAAWTCTRADHWDGSGSAATQFLAPAAATVPAASALTAPALTTAVQPRGRACSRYEQYVVADTWWRSPRSGHSYLLAAGSRHVTTIATTGGLTTAATATPGHTVALAAVRPRTAVEVTAALDTGETAHTLR